MSQDLFITPAGKQKLERELAELKGPKRQAMAEAIREARSHGDLKENAAYHECKLNQSRLEARITDIEQVLELAKVVERPDDAGDSAHLGSRVTLLDMKWEEELVVSLVGSYEADPANDLISINSPMGGALLGKVPGDEIEVEAPSGMQKYRVVKVEVS